MPERLFVPRPEGAEELRAWAETISDLHYVGSIVVERGETFLPGEDVEEIRIAWHETTGAFGEIVNALSATPRRVRPEYLSDVKLDGPVGSAKRSRLRRLYDNAMAWLQSDPQTDEKQRIASEAAERHMDVGSVALDSLGACASE